MIIISPDNAHELSLTYRELSLIKEMMGEFIERYEPILIPDVLEFEKKVNNFYNEKFTH